MIHSKLLEEADHIINGDREQTYGSPDKNLRLIAHYWSGHLSQVLKKDVGLTVDDVCVMMILLKTARLANTPNHHDSMVDIAGYDALMDKCQQLDTAETDKLVARAKVPDKQLVKCKKNFGSNNCGYPECKCSRTSLVSN